MSCSPAPLLLLAACAATAPQRADVEAALEALRAHGENGAVVAPIESELLELAHDLAAGPRHELAILDVGADALAARLHLIRAARASLDVQTYIWAPDDSGALMMEECLAAARRGVRVRLLVDQMGVSGRPVHAAVAHANLELRLYNPVAGKSEYSVGELLFEAAADFWSVNHRMHNKVMVVDGRVAIVGGRNVQDAYFDMDPEFNYIDRDVLVLGPAARDAQGSFDEYWAHGLAVPVDRMPDIGHELVRLAKSGERPRVPVADRARMADVLERADLRDAAEVLPHSPLLPADRVEFVADPPTKRTSNGDLVLHMNAERRIVDEVQEYLLFQSNYLIFSNYTFRNLRRMREEKPDVVVHFVTNSLAATGCSPCYALSRKQRLTMDQLGLRIHELRPIPGDVRHFCARYDLLIAEDERLGPDHHPYDKVAHMDEQLGPQLAIHSKTIVIDGRIAIIGSHNFDPRSELYNTEAALLIWGDEVVGAVERELRLSMENRNSWTIARKRRIPVWREVNGVVSSISRALPVFDLWPLRHTTAYELREGAEPVPVEDPLFHARYRDVGELPEVPLGMHRTANYLFSAFGGLLTSLL